MRISRVVKSNMRRNVKLVLLLAVIWIFLILYFIQGGQKVSVDVTIHKIRHTRQHFRDLDGLIKIFTVI